MNLFTMKNAMPIMVVCILIFFLLFLRPKNRVFIKGLINLILGFIFILLGNEICKYVGVEVHIGVNCITLLTCTILGFPGVCGLFVIPFL